MPSRAILREFAENEYYHVFNRGIEKRQIFNADQDYKIFKYYMFIYLADPVLIQELYPQIQPRLISKNLKQNLELISYCLMPNHFHFLFRQTSKDSISKFMKQLINAYTKYFNEKYQRSGPLLQGRFKALRIPTDELLLHISRYIHLNPVVAGIVKNPKDYNWSSYKSITEKNEKLINPKPILGFFRTTENYNEFVENQINYGKELSKIKHLILD